MFGQGLVFCFLERRKKNKQFDWLFALGIAAATPQPDEGRARSNSVKPDPWVTPRKVMKVSILLGEWFYYNGTSIIFGAPEEDEPLELKHTINLKQYSLSLKPLVAKYKFLTNDYLNEEVVEKRSSDIASNASGLTQSVTQFF